MTTILTRSTDILRKEVVAHLTEAAAVEHAKAMLAPSMLGDA